MATAVSKEICSICFETIEPLHIKTLPCRHSFHTDCISRWLESSKTCPLDRTLVTGVPQQLFVKFLGIDEGYPIPLEGLSCESSIAELAERVRKVQRSLFPLETMTAIQRLLYPINRLVLYGKCLEGEKTLLQSGFLPEACITILAFKALYGSKY